MPRPGDRQGAVEVQYPTKYRDDFDVRQRPAGDADDRRRERSSRSAPTATCTRSNSATGKKLWGRNVLADYKADKGFFGVACSPIVIGEKLLVNVGGKGAGVVAFDPATGKEVWKATDDAASYSSPTAAEIDGKPAAVFLTRVGLRVLDPANGKVLLRVPVAAAAGRERAGRDAARVEGRDLPDRVVLDRRRCSCRRRRRELDEVWSNDKTLSSQYNTPVRVGDYLYGVHGRAGRRDRETAVRGVEDGRR